MSPFDDASPPTWNNASVDSGAGGATALEREGSPLDLWLAMLAGDRVWHEGDDEASTREHAASAFLLVTLFITLLVQWVALAGRVDLTPSAHDRRLLVLNLLSVGAAAGLAIRPVQLLVGTPRSSARFGTSLVWRGLAYLVLIAATAALLSRFRFLAAIPLGLVGGSDALLTLWALGVRPQPLRWAKRFLFSTVHFGVLGAMLAAMLVEADSSRALTGLLEIYVAMWLGIVVAGFTVVGMDRLSRLVAEQQAAKERDIREQERLVRAHWLHDDVLSEVRLSTLRLKDVDDLTAARAELEDLDHRLRLRQLDEVIRGGEPHLYEILQPHLRRAQSLGVQLHRVPPLEMTDRTVDQDSAHLFHRVVSILTSNAINAGATRLDIDLLPLTHDQIVVTVTDDAGGFDLEAVPAGRGLASLRADLGTHAIRRRNVDGGSAVSVNVPIGARTHEHPEEVT
jgi:signal transduction histidine kinase